MYLERFDLGGRTAFITGGGRGIGLASAQALAEAGARVVIADRNPAVLEEGRAALAAAGHDTEAVLLDVTRSADVERAAAECEARHGGVDILVANAGIALPDRGAEDMPDELWLRVIDVNLHGAFWCCRAFGRAMLGRGRGAIVTMGSMSGLISNRPQRQAHYNASKAAVHHMTRSLAGEWAARGVRVNAVAPTYVDTPMSAPSFGDPDLYPVWMENTPMRRPARGDEIASAVLFLASDAASAVTGAVLTVDCGYTIW